jgi:hypothetical protein
MARLKPCHDTGPAVMVSGSKQMSERFWLQTYRGLEETLEAKIPAVST